MRTSLSSPRKRAKVSAISRHDSILISPLRTRIRLMWVKRCSPRYQPLFLEVARAVCQYIQNPMLICLASDRISVFNTDKMRWGRWTSVTGLQANIASHAIVLDAERLLIVRNGPEMRGDIAILHTGETPFRMEALPDMQAKRSFSGYLHYNGVILAFGGLISVQRRQYLYSVEAFELKVGTSWAVLTAILQRHCYDFVPCEHRSTAYIAGNLTGCVQVFDLNSYQFHPGIVLVPPECHYRVSFVVGDELVLIAWETIARVGLNTGEITTQANTHINSDAGLTPIVSGNVACWTFAGVCFAAKVTTLSVELETYGRGEICL